MAGEDLPDEQSFALLLQASAAMGAMLVSVQAELAAAHTPTSDAQGALAGAAPRRDRHRLLADEPWTQLSAPHSGTSFEAWHLGVVATGAEAGKAVRASRPTSGAAAPRRHNGGGTVWAWLGGKRTLAFADIDRVWSTRE